MILNIDDCKVIDNYFESEGYTWSALTLIEASKECEEFDMPLAGINLTHPAWGIKTIKDFIYQAKRCERVGDYPIILTDEGVICDGLHRICRAILAGKETIKAKRLQTMPSADSYTKPEEN